MYKRSLTVSICVTRRAIAVACSSMVLCLGGAPALAATYNLADSSLGASASYNGTPGFYGSGANYAINAMLEPDHTNNASWSNRTSGTDSLPAWLRVDLPALAGEMELTSVKLYDRSGSPRNAPPFTMTVYNDADTALDTFTYTAGGQGLYSWTPATPIANAAYVVYNHTGTVSSDLFLRELDAWFTGDFLVGGASPNIDTTLLRDTTLVGASAGTLANVEAVRFVQNSNNWFEFSEIEAISGGSNVAAGGFGSGYAPWGNVAQLVDGDLGNANGLFLATATFADYYEANINNLGVTLPASGLESARYYQRDITRTGLDYQNLQLEAYSDAARTTLIYSRPVSAASNASGHWESFDFLFGGVAWATLDETETYRFRINGDTLEADVLAVWQMTGSQTGIDLNNATARVVLDSGSIGVGDMFQLLDADFVTGEFSDWILPSLSGGLHWDLSQLTVDGTILAIPEPASLALLGLGGLLALHRRR